MTRSFGHGLRMTLGCSIEAEKRKEDISRKGAKGAKFRKFEGKNEN
jgi:hypothetical protein